jgi:uncharacterized protein YdhG (YjbR/CyaY superfamily)
METVEPDRREPLERLRGLCRDILADHEEVMAYGMPGYRKGEFLTAFNSQKNYIAFYAGQAAIETFKDRLKGADCGKGCIRYKRIAAMDFDVIRSILEDIRDRRA